MNISAEVKEFLRHEGKALVFENGEPEFVISTFRDFMKSARGGNEPQGQNTRFASSAQQESVSWVADVKREKIEEINREIAEIAKEDLFSPFPPADANQDRQDQTRQFYRELG